MSFVSWDNLRSSNFEDIPRLPKTISFVLSGLSIKQLSKHQLRIRCKSELRLSNPSRVVHGKRQQELSHPRSKQLNNFDKHLVDRLHKY